MLYGNKYCMSQSHVEPSKWSFGFSWILWHVFTFFFFCPCAWTVTLHGFTVHETKITIHALFITVHALKNIKNGSHGTIHTFKNYFATVLSVFNSVSVTISSIQTNPKSLLLIFYGINLARGKHFPQAFELSPKPYAISILFNMLVKFQISIP